jgi:hypothetical protein
VVVDSLLYFTAYNDVDIITWAGRKGKRDRWRMENDMMKAAAGCPHIKTLRVSKTLRVFALRGLLNFSRRIPFGG